ncbi:uncharacterized protein LOC132166944 isoform X2 [Corylus avellana]|uniref:uncharacterized protein LOC132166944 isoform X2 n=1 Tax=Corylus avellana TaxID=13451 RepID=UPI00286B512D|nr:uncharacterized protein LOC132166944 isoform X2 [Corylus avellana]
MSLSTTLMSLCTSSEVEPGDGQPLCENDHNAGSCYGAPASITLEKGTPNEGNDCACTPMTKENNESSCCTPARKKGKFLLRPVPPFNVGEGLPYAPIDWPNPGDNWSWGVSRRIGNGGYYLDRYLYPPRRLQKHPGRRQRFLSKISVERYIKSEFPAADIDAFFASFIWNVPSTNNFWTKVKSSPLPPEEPSQVERVEVENEGMDETPPQIQRKRNRKTCTFPVKSKRLTRQSAKAAAAFSTAVANGRNDHFAAVSSYKDMDGVIDLCSLDEDTVSSESTDKDLKGISDSKGSQVQVSQQNDISPDHSFLPTCHSSTAIRGLHMKNPQESPADAIAEDFDNYLDSLEHILAPPPHEALSLHTSTINYLAVDQHEMAESRRKLSSLLNMDFPSLVSSGNLSELTILASTLRKDPSLNVDQLITLKLIEEIPLISEAFLETKGVIEQADKFFADLEAKKAKVTPLKNEYRELKDKAGQLQREIDSSSTAVEEIDDQIAQLESRRAALSSTIETKKKEKVKLASSQKMKANSIQTFAGEMQLAYSEKPEWELKKINAACRAAGILAKFAILKGFSF